MRILAITAVASVALATMVHAGAIVNVQSDTASRVFFDGEEVGTAPMSIKDVKPGFHHIRVVDPSNDVREFDFYSPESVTIVKDINLTAAAAAPSGSVIAPAPAPGTVPAPADVQPQVAPAGAQVAPAQAAATDQSYEDARRAEQERQKRRLRNTLLGAAAANELFNKGGSKSTVRGVTLGGALLNELFNH